jgi:tripartite-type tricarboxylate transporter receptor subunit TctC
VGSALRRFVALVRSSQLIGLSKKKIVAVATFGAAIAALTPPCIAQIYPDRPIHLISAYPAGGQTDIVARIIAPALTQALGKSVVVEDRPGGDGIVGFNYVSKARPDGYTLLIGNSSMLAVTVNIVKDLPFDAIKDFAPVIALGKGPFVLEVNPKLPVHSLPELIALAKQQPGKLNFGLGNLGSIPQIVSEELKQRAGVTWVNIDYKGAGPMLVDLLGGQTDLTVDNLSSSISSIKAGRLRAIAVTDKTNLLPGVPTIEESGYSGIHAESWHGVLAPAHAPPAIVQKLNQTINGILKRPEIIKQLNTLSLSVLGGSPSDFADLIKRDKIYWAGVIKSTGVKLN